MLIKFLVDEDFVNYKKCSMFIGFPYCTFKCDREANKPICQNSSLAKQENITADINNIYQRYINNPLTKAIVCGGLEPFESWEDLYSLIKLFRDNNCNADFVIYTGFNKDEIQDKVIELQKFQNIVIKFGRFIPDSQSKFDEVLGVTLASNNQYAEVIS